MVEGEGEDVQHPGVVPRFERAAVELGEDLLHVLLAHEEELRDEVGLDRGGVGGAAPAVTETTTETAAPETAATEVVVP